jgi:hypothetical protein
MEALVVSAGLKEFFAATVRESLDDLCLPAGPAADYVVDLLVRFARTDELRPRTPWGGRLESYPDHVLAIERWWRADGTAFDPTQEVRLRHHFADCALFMTGFFWDRMRSESVTRHFVAQGRRAYRFLAEYDRARGRAESRVYQALATDFESYAGVLTYMREVYLGADFAPGMRQLFVRLVSGF